MTGVKPELVVRASATGTSGRTKYVMSAATPTAAPTPKATSATMNLVSTLSFCSGAQNGAQVRPFFSTRPMTPKVAPVRRAAALVPANTYVIVGMGRVVATDSAAGGVLASAAAVAGAISKCTRRPV